MLTGHSLGGALATLAAHNFATQARKYANESAVSVACYTFGAPRTGNKAWAREADELYPSCWHVIHDQARCWPTVPEQAVGRIRLCQQLTGWSVILLAL